MSEATGYETVDRKVAKNSFTPLQAWDDIRKVFELLRADENGALLVKGLADVTIGEISVDNVELIDSTGKEAAIHSKRRDQSICERRISGDSRNYNRCRHGKHRTRLF